MAHGLRYGMGMAFCLALGGCRTPDFYGSALGEAKPPPLTVIRPDPVPPTPVRSSTLDTRTVVQSNPTEIQQASGTSSEPPSLAASNVPQTLPAPLLEPARRPDLAVVRNLVQQAQGRLDTIDNYVIRFRRREVIQGRAMPEDLLLCKFRQRPFSVYMKSIGNNAHEGREIIYVAGRNNNLMHVRTGKGDVIAGICLEMEPNSPRATANSRHTIDEAGMENLIRRLTGVLNRVESGQTGETLTYLGPQPRTESRVPLEAVAQKLLPGKEKLLPQGGKRTFYFNADPDSTEYQLPVLVITEDETGREVEYYLYDRLSPNVGLTEKDFDPTVVWGKR